jgi:hypothetical protein
MREAARRARLCDELCDHGVDTGRVGAMNEGVVYELMP